MVGFKQKLLSWTFISMLAIIGVTALEPIEELTGQPCSHESAIKLPSAKKCLVPVSSAYTWTVAQIKCEHARGTLYRLPMGTLESRPQLLRCLESRESNKFNDMWINGVSLWSPHFSWINGSVLNRVQFCPTLQRPLSVGQSEALSLNVDYCVARCQERGIAYTVLQAQQDGDYLKCDCVNTLTPQQRLGCSSQVLNFENRDRSYIVPSSGGVTIDVERSSSFSSSEIMCGLLDNSTAVDNRLKSDTCFTQRPFICAMGSSQNCIDPRCASQHCYFSAASRCLLRVSLSYSWYDAREYCRSLGGDLWVHRGRGDIQDVSESLDGDTKFWIGTTNYQWQFDANSAKLFYRQDDLRQARCAHIYRRRLPSGLLSRDMEWSDTPCDQAKAFLCEFDQGNFSLNETNLEVVCPWPILPIDRTDPILPVTETVVIRKTDDDSFPYAAVISGIVAGLVLLTCLSLLFSLCCGCGKKREKDTFAFVPYYAGDTSHVEFETMSNADHTRNTLRSASEHGSQVEFFSKSLDRRHLDAMERKFAESQQHLANSSMEERAFSSYHTMPAKGREYTTLEANMTIQDEAELERMRRSLRGKPEVTLVTDNVDMNFTVNHAHGASRGGSDLERSMDDYHHHLSASGYEQRNRSYTDIALHDL